MGDFTYFFRAYWYDYATYCIGVSILKNAIYELTARVSYLLYALIDSVVTFIK